MYSRLAIFCVMMTSFVHGGTLALLKDIDKATVIIREFEKIPEKGIPSSILE